MVKQHLLDYSQLNSGVPQGSFHGQVLFLLYVSGLFHVGVDFTSI